MVEDDVVWSGARLTGHRIRARLTQSELAVKMLLSSDMILRYEKNRTEPNRQRWMQLARALNIRYLDLARRLETPEEDLDDALQFGPRDWGSTGQDSRRV